MSGPLHEVPEFYEIQNYSFLKTVNGWDIYFEKDLNVHLLVHILGCYLLIKEDLRTYKCSCDKHFVSAAQALCIFLNDDPSISPNSR